MKIDQQELTLESRRLVDFNHSMRRAIKQHNCAGCSEVIEKGEEYCHLVVFSNGRHINIRFHSLEEAVWYYIREYCDLNFEPAKMVYYEDDPSRFMLAVIYEGQDNDDVPFGHLLFPETAGIDLLINGERIYHRDQAYLDKFRLISGENLAVFEPGHGQAKIKFKC